MFDRNNFVLSGLSGKQKKQNIIVTLAVAVFFILSAFTFMNFLYCLSDCIGSIVCSSVDVSLKDAQRSVPIFLSFFMTLSGFMVAHTFYRNESPEILQKKAKKHATIGIVIGAIIIIYVIVMRIMGKYLSLAEGAPSLIYPLDSVIYSVLFIAFGIFIWKYLGKCAKDQIFVAPSRAPIQKRGRGIRSFFRTFWLLIHGYIAYSLAVMLVSLVAFLSVALWELCYNNLKEDKKKEFTLPLALIHLAVSVISAVVYFIALKGNLDGPSNVGFGILPIAFSASVNFATLLVVAMPLIVSVTALIKGIIRKVKTKK